MLTMLCYTRSHSGSALCRRCSAQCKSTKGCVKGLQFLFFSIISTKKTWKLSFDFLHVHCRLSYALTTNKKKDQIPDLTVNGVGAFIFYIWISIPLSFKSELSEHPWMRQNVCLLHLDQHSLRDIACLHYTKHLCCSLTKTLEHGGCLQTQ